MSSGSAAGGAGGAGAAAPEAAASGALVDITERVDRAKSFALNYVGAPEAVFDPASKAVLSSDADSQLILFAPFKETVKVFSLTINAPADAAPTTLRLYANRPALSFEDCEDAKGATQSIALKAGDVGKEIKLKMGLFAAVNQLYVFLDREGAERSSVSTITFRGVTVQSANVSKIFEKKPGEE